MPTSAAASRASVRARAPGLGSTCVSCPAISTRWAWRKKALRAQLHPLGPTSCEQRNGTTSTIAAVSRSTVELENRRIDVGESSAVFIGSPPVLYTNPLAMDVGEMRGTTASLRTPFRSTSYGANIVVNIKFASAFQVFNAIPGILSYQVKLPWI